MSSERTVYVQMLDCGQPDRGKDPSEAVFVVIVWVTIFTRIAGLDPDSALVWNLS